MDVFTKKILMAINSLSDQELSVDDVCDYKKIDLSKFNVENASIIETGGFIPFGKNLIRDKCYLSIDSLKNIWDDLK